tara:strand:- start:582 stop:920 length:339 start_codon:yes stop_codon:yes gene_type:complete
MKNWAYQQEVTHDHQIRIGDLSNSDYHVWIPELEIVLATEKAVRIAIPHKYFKLEGETSFDKVEIWLPKSVLTLYDYNIKTQSGCGWAWEKVYDQNIKKEIKSIKERQKKKK